MEAGRESPEELLARRVFTSGLPTWVSISHSAEHENLSLMRLLNRCWKPLLTLAALLLPGFVPDGSVQAAEESLFIARPLTAENSFTIGIEGPACDARGNIYAVNFERQQTIGRVTADGKGEVIVELPGNRAGNGKVIGSPRPAE